MISEDNGSHHRTGGMTVSLADPSGNVVGGGVAGLRAATPVQVFIYTTTTTTTIKIFKCLSSLFAL